MNETIKSRTVSVRAIDNGYVVRTETWSGDGTYACREVFTDTRPDLRLPQAA